MTEGRRLPLVTIVTPSYNQGRFIAATIESVLGQDYPYIEYIIMDAASKDETIVLSPFVVTSNDAARYQATEATSGTRARVELFESQQSISVVTRELIEDIGAGRVVDAAKYVAGVYESTIPNAQDRTTIRGFQNDGATIDGFSYFSFANVDPVLIDRIEVVKGPNAITAR